MAFHADADGRALSWRSSKTFPSRCGWVTVCWSPWCLDGSEPAWNSWNMLAYVLGAESLFWIVLVQFGWFWLILTLYLFSDWTNAPATGWFCNFGSKAYPLRETAGRHLPVVDNASGQQWRESEENQGYEGRDLLYYLCQWSVKKKVLSVTILILWICILSDSIISLSILFEISIDQCWRSRHLSAALCLLPWALAGQDMVDMYILHHLAISCHGPHCLILLLCLGGVFCIHFLWFPLLSLSQVHRPCQSEPWNGENMVCSGA